MISLDRRSAAVMIVCAFASAPFFARAADSAAPGETALSLAAAAAAEATSAKAIRWAFSMSYTDLSAAAPRAYRLRFDPRLPEGSRWQAVNPLLADMSEDEKKRFAALTRNETPDSQLLYDGLDDAVASAEVVSEDGAKVRLRMPVLDEKLPKAMRQSLSLTATLDRNSRAFEEIRVVAAKPFKPAPVARIETFETVQVYQRYRDDGLPVLVQSRTRLGGKAMFKPFTQDIEITYSDFLPITE